MDAGGKVAPSLGTCHTGRASWGRATGVVPHGADRVGRQPSRGHFSGGVAALPGRGAGPLKRVTLNVSWD